MPKIRKQELGTFSVGRHSTKDVSAPGLVGLSCPIYQLLSGFRWFSYSVVGLVVPRGEEQISGLRTV